MLIPLSLQKMPLTIRSSRGHPEVFDVIRKRWFLLTPEEHVRQLMLQYLTQEIHYPKAKVAVEKVVQVEGLRKRFDIMVLDDHMQPWMIIECKAPNVPLSDNTFHQLLQYQHNLQARYWVMTNGHQTLCADAGELPEISWLSGLPAYERIIS